MPTVTQYNCSRKSERAMRMKEEKEEEEEIEVEEENDWWHVARVA